MESQFQIRKTDAGVAFWELEEAGVRLAKMDGKLDDKAERPCGCPEDSEGVRDGDGGFINEGQR